MESAIELCSLPLSGDVVNRFLESAPFHWEYTNVALSFKSEYLAALIGFNNLRRNWNLAAMVNLWTAHYIYWTIKRLQSGACDPHLRYIYRVWLVN